MTDLSEPYGQMVVTECIFLANYRAGCALKSLFYNSREVSLIRSAPTSLKKFNLNDFYINSKNTAAEMLEGNHASASKWLKSLLAQFEFSMADDKRMQVIKLAKKVWIKKTKQSDREVIAIQPYRFLNFLPLIFAV